LGDSRPRRVVLKVSGKIINPDNPRLVGEYAGLLGRVRGEGVEVAVVVGGGPIARRYIEAARSVGASRSMMDILGIEASRLNARLLIAGLWPLAYPVPPRSIHGFLEAYSTGRIVVCGGFQPGQSTAGTAALVAEAMGADLLVLATTVHGVYDRDPRRHRDARLLRRLTYEEFRRVVEQSVEPGHYELLDPLAVSVLVRSGIPCRVVYGFEPGRVYRALLGGDEGSLITP